MKKRRRGEQGGHKEPAQSRQPAQQRRPPAPKAKAFDFWRSDVPQSLAVVERVIGESVLGRLDQEISDAEVAKLL